MFVLFGSMKSLGIDCVGRKLVYDYDVFPPPKKKKINFFVFTGGYYFATLKMIFFVNALQKPEKRLFYHKYAK